MVRPPDRSQVFSTVTTCCRSAFGMRGRLLENGLKKHNLVGFLRAIETQTIMSLVAAGCAFNLRANPDTMSRRATPRAIQFITVAGVLVAVYALHFLVTANTPLDA